MLKIPLKMALPALRQPKMVPAKGDNAKKQVVLDANYVILTLKDDRKLVVTSDAYHGIITEEEMFKCVFCSTSIELDRNHLEVHKNSKKHKAWMANIPYIDGCNEHLMRLINSDNQCYCTICNVMLSTYTAARHIGTEVHLGELDKAYARAIDYKPYS